MKRVFLIVLDSVGIGAEPDADLYGDVGSNTLCSASKSPYFHLPNLQKMGLFNIEGVTCGERVANPSAAFARLREKSNGKDTTIGHWEIAGITSKTPLPTFPHGFPEEIIKPFEEITGKKALCNLPYSGTEVIRDYGKECVEQDRLIVYTSADSVFQIAAHEDVVPIEQLYEICRQARKLLTGKYGVGRVIARPFIGTYPNYTRTANRHDFSLEPPAVTMLDQIKKQGLDVISVGKIVDIFAGRGITKAIRTKGNAEGIDRTMDLIANEDFTGLCFINLVDFDMLWGHRNDVDGYAKGLSYFDEKLPSILAGLQEDDLLMITADHGCDPGKKDSTDHTREYIPWLVYGDQVKNGVDLKTLPTFSDIGATVLEALGVAQEIAGTSRWKSLIK